MHHTTMQWYEEIDRSRFDKDAIFFFDFDGVLASQDEEQVYRLPIQPAERSRLERLAPGYGLDAALYPDTPYLRHLIFQARSVSMPIMPNDTMLEFCQSLRDDDVYHIVTARSGRWAVHRMFNFLTRHHLVPQETFCLGRASKAHLIERLRLEWPGRQFVYFEDSMTHIEACKELQDPDLHIIEVQWPVMRYRVRNLMTAVMEPQ